ncbi:MAG: acetylglutamate kinase [Anaerolineae bacterium]
MAVIYKIGGAPLEDKAYIAGLIAHLKGLPEPPIIVHGGGKAIARLQTAFGITPQQIGGLRVTDDQTMELVAMALVGQANVNLVAALVNAGIAAQGFSGVDRGLLRSTKLTHPEGDLGRVGRITQVQVEVLKQALSSDITPVIAPIGLADDDGLHNINADQAAGAIAAAMNVNQVIFLTDVQGVLQDGAILSNLTRESAQAMITNGVASGGMAVKLKAALDALSAGVTYALITNLDGLNAGIGTTIY